MKEGSIQLEGDVKSHARIAALQRYRRATVNQKSPLLYELISQLKQISSTSGVSHVMDASFMGQPVASLC